MIVWRHRSSQRGGLSDRFEDKASSLVLPVKPHPWGNDQTLKKQAASSAGFSNLSRPPSHLDGLSAPRLAPPPEALSQDPRTQQLVS